MLSFQNIFYVIPILDHSAQQCALHRASGTDCAFFAYVVILVQVLRLFQMANRANLWCCYVLSFVCERGGERCYYGATEIRNGRSAQAACEVRLRYHRTHPLKWIRLAVENTLQIQALCTLTKKNALAQEAIHTARALEDWETDVRGACWSGPYMGPAWRAGAAAVRRATSGLSGQQARQAVFDYAATLDEKEPLCRHLAGEPFSGAQQPPYVLPQQKRPPRPSGTPGNKRRRRMRIRDPSFAKSAKEKRLHRGQHPQERRKEENKKRQPSRRKKRQAADA